MATAKVWKSNLNPKQIKFCEYYVSEEFFCNWTKAYCKAYSLDFNEKKDYESARRQASLLLTNLDIMNYIDSILEDMALNDQRVDKELAKLILQDDEKSTKLQAIREYNTLRARIEKGRQKALNDWDISKDVIPQVQVTIQANQSNWTVIE